MKYKIFSLTGFILGCVSITVGIVAVVFSAISFFRTGKHSAHKSF